MNRDNNHGGIVFLQRERKKNNAEVHAWKTGTRRTARRDKETLSVGGRGKKIVFERESVRGKTGVETVCTRQEKCNTTKVKECASSKITSETGTGTWKVVFAQAPHSEKA